MTFIRLTILILALFVTSITFGQATCETISSDLVKQFDSYSQKKFNKLLHSKKTDLNTLCNIATYFRSKGDTTYRQWCATFIHGLDKYYKGDCDKGNKHHSSSMFLTSGKVYYYMDDYKNAITQLKLALYVKHSDPCINYFLSEAEKKSKK